jgi:hypothetical protein
MSFLKIDGDKSLAYQGADIEALMAMLETKRPHKSKTESKFIQDWLIPLGVESDSFGNLYKRILGDGDSVLWSSHTDTVHDSGGRQAIRKEQGIITLSKRSKANCLGADDIAGIWLMREMILAGKPGLYVFHRAEECGGLGSDYIAIYGRDLLEGIQAAIALDRKGYQDVVTFQGRRGCSDTFADSLATGLDMNFRADDTGLFTDTANYFHVIPECTNLSVGYFAQHSKHESLDSEFLIALRHKLIALDTSKLIIARDPDSEAEYPDDGFENDYPDFVPRKPNLDYYDDSDFGVMTRAIADHPESVARLIEDYGIRLDEVLQAIYDDTGYLPR